MGVIDVAGRQKRMQESFDRLTRTVGERRAAREVLDHLLICHRSAVSQRQDLRQPQGRKSGLGDRSHVSPGAFDPEQFDGTPEMIGVHQLGAGVAAEDVHHAAVGGRGGGAVDEAIGRGLAPRRRIVPQVTGHAARYSLRPAYAGAVARTRFRTAEAESRSRAFATRRFAPAPDHRRMIVFTAGIAARAMLSSSRSNPSTRATASWAPASSPQTPAQRPARCAAWTTDPI